MRPVFSAAAFVLLTAGLSARADTLTYALTSTFRGGGNITGTLTLDNATGEFTAVDLTTTNFPQDNNSGYTVPYYQRYQSQDAELFVGTTDVAEQDTNIVFDFGNSIFVGYVGLNLPLRQLSFVIDEGLRGFEATSFDTLLEPAIPPLMPVLTPEPSSIALLGTGLLGVVGLVRKRLA